MTDDIQALLDRIAAGTHTEADLATLRRALLASGQGNIVQIGKYNIYIGEGQDIRIGDTVYQGPDAAAIQTALRAVLQEQTNVKSPQLGEEESAYRQQVIAAYNYLDFSGFESADLRLSQVALQEIFVHLSLTVRKVVVEGEGRRDGDPKRQAAELEERSVELGAPERHRDTDKEGRRQERIVEVQEPITLAEALSRNVLVVGEPGAGKSTLLRWLAVTYAQGLQREAERLGPEADADRLPVYIALGQLPKQYLGPDEREVPDWRAFLRVHVARQPAMAPETEALIVQALADGRCLLLFDGLDEIADWQARARVARSIAQQFSDDNRAVIGSRPGGLAEVEGALQPTFRRCQIERFTDSEIRQFFIFWYRLDKGLTEEEQQAEADTLFSDLQKNQRVLELARTPLLATIILLIRRNEGRLPERRVELYERCCKILIENWEAHHDVAYMGVLRNLGWERHLRLLAPLAYTIHAQEQWTSAQAAELVERLAQGVQDEGLCTEATRARFEAEQFLHTLGVRSGLLQHLGGGQFGFPHQTFQEYLAARHIVGWKNPEDTIDLFMKHLHQAHWTQVHELAIGILCSNNATVDKAEHLIRQILNVYPRPWQLLRPDRSRLGRLIPEYQLDRRLAYVLGREPELVANGCATAMPNKETDPIRYEVMLVCVEGLLRQRDGEAWARALGQLGVSDGLAYQILLLALRSDEPGVVEAAARSLFQLRMITPEAVDRLLKTLNDGYPEGVRVAAARSLGEWGLASAEIVDALMRAAGHGDDDLLRQAARASLVRLACTDSAAMDAVFKALQTPSSYRWLALDCIGELGQASPEVVKALISALGDFEGGRQAAIDSLIRLGENNPGVVEALVQALGASNYSMSKAAAEVLGRLGRTNPAIPDTLLGMLGGHFSDVSGGAASVLVEIADGGLEVRDRLLVAFHSDNWRVRLAAVRILSRVSPPLPWAAELLIKALGDPDSPVRASAARKLGEAGHTSQEAISALVRTCSDDDHTVRAAAIHSLGQLRCLEGEALDATIAALAHDGYADVREAAATSLGLLAKPSAKAVDALVQALADPERAYHDTWNSAVHPRSSIISLPVKQTDVRKAAAYSLGHLGLASPDVLAVLIGALHPETEADRDADVREAAASSLDWLGNADQDVVDALVQALNDENSEVRTAAAGSLGLIGSVTPTVIDALLRALADNRDLGTSRAAAVSLGCLDVCNPAILEELLDAMTHGLQVEWQNATCSLVKLGASHGEVIKFLEDQVAHEGGWSSQHVAAALCLFLLGHRPLEIVDLLAQGTGNLFDIDINQAALRQVLELGKTDDHVAEILVEALIPRWVGVAAYAWLQCEMASCLDELAQKIHKSATLSCSTWLTRWAAIRTATRPDSVPSDTILAGWIDALNDTSWCVRWEAATALGSLNQIGRDGIAGLEQRLDDSEELVKCAAVTSLGRQRQASQGAVEVIGGFLSNGNWPLRLASAESLGALGRDSPQIISLLLRSFEGDTYWGIRQAAAMSLGRLAEGAPQVVDALRRAVADVGEVASVRAGAVEGLVWAGDASTDTIAVLARALGDESAEISLLAGLALAGLGQLWTKNVDELAAQMGSDDPSLRREAAWRLRWWVREDPAIVSTLLRAVRNPDADVRRIALLGLGSLDRVDAIGCQALILGLGDTERPVRDAAFDALVRLGKTDITIVNALFDALGYADWDIRQAVCHSFGMLGTSAPREVADALRAALHDTNESVRYTAVESLGLLGRADDETVAELLRFFSYPEREVDRTNAEDLRRAAARSLARIGHFKKEIVDELLAMLKTEGRDQDQKEEAIECLVTLGRASSPALAMMRGSLEAPDLDIRNGVGRCLIELGYTTPATVRNLIGEALHYDPVHQGHLRARAVDRLTQLGQVDYEITEWLIRAFEKNDGYYGYDRANTLASVLGQIGYRQPAAVTSLLRMAGQPDQERRLAAVEALGRVGQAGSDVLETLVQTLRDTNEHVRRTAARSLGQLSISVQAELRFVLVALNRALYDQEDDVRREALGSIRKLLNGRPIPGRRRR